ncbi:hypothetical protein MKW98_031914 [Papaver atlanticum]|uniref:Uncharacterized protein n=1 Tax=Papaver atlanticum TaxID=357466 RepID=A0AAD4SFD9_9MAGN|nr:hypothetical protein MKW98_031914 [Papaver atlanticum]
MQGISCGFRKAKDLNLQNVELASDCLPALREVDRGIVVHRVIGQYLDRSRRMGKIINEIIKYKLVIGQSVLMHMFRGGNEVANSFSQMCTKPGEEVPYYQANFDVEDNQLDAKHRRIKRFLKSDAEGTLYPIGGSP